MPFHHPFLTVVILGKENMLSVNNDLPFCKVSRCYASACPQHSGLHLNSSLPTPEGLVGQPLDFGREKVNPNLHLWQQSLVSFDSLSKSVANPFMVNSLRSNQNIL